MSCSTTSTPITGNCICRSEKSWKRIWHRAYRAAVKRAIRAGVDPLPHFREHSNVWTFGKDGKTYWNDERFGDVEVYRVFGK